MAEKELIALANSIVAFLQQPENSDILNTILQWNIDNTGNYVDKNNFFMNFSDILREKDEKLQQEYHGYPSMLKRLEDKIELDFRGHSGASYAVMMRGVETILKAKYLKGK